MKYKGIVISDIHVGAMSLEKLHREYIEMFIKYINKMKKLDFLIVDGDFFHRKFYLNDQESVMAYAMLRELVIACKEKDAVIRIVYGTESHECNQYDILSLLKIYDKIEVVKYAKDEELLPDLHILYLPEEHLLNKDKYYEKYFSNTKKYNYIFGHGVIREVWREQVSHMETNEDENNTSKRKRVPIFKSNELLKCCRGQVFFGHYHINQNMDDLIFSVGSFSRWQFGEEGPKGFYELSCDTEKDKYKATFIENTMAEKYATLSYGYDNKIFKDEDAMQESIESIDKLISRDVYEHVKFVFNVPSSVKNPEATINFLKEKFKTNDKVKVEITHGYIEEKKRQQKEQLELDNTKYGFIFNKSMSLEDKVHQFITVEYNKELDVKKISDYLYKPLMEILTLE